eukprot:scaffold54819_cov62-Attheya_sp.AAC.3
MGASASREKFRESVTALIEVDVSPDDAEFWDELWKIPSSPNEVFELISPEAARDLGVSDENVEHLCWGTGASPVHSENLLSKAEDGVLGLVIGGGDEMSESQQQTKQAAQTDEQQEQDDNEDSQEPLALLVIHAAMHMLFLPQFTCDFYEEDEEDSTKRQEEQRQTKDDRDMRNEVGLGPTKKVEAGVLLVPRPTSIVWTVGAGFVPKAGSETSSRKYDKNRIEILRLLLAACCDPLFSPADEYNPLASRWLAVAVAADAPNAVCLFYSLLNTILSYDPKGIGVPYSGAFANDTHVKLVELSAQALCVLLDCGLPGNPEKVRNADGEPIIDFEEASKGGFNIFRTLLARIDSGNDLTFIFKGFVRLLKNVYESKNTYLPNSMANLECFQELLVIFWKMLEENPMFINHILTKCDVNEIIVPICYLMYQSRKDPAQIGLVHICTFVLLKLSGERSFGVNLNKPFTTRLPCDLPLFTGGHTDLISITLHKLVVNGAYKLVPLYSCFITIICNISPYWRSMSLVAAVKLVNLFELFSSPKFLYSGENAHRHLALLLEVFNNVIQYQFSGNQHLIYAIIRRKDSFGRLASLTLEKATSQSNKIYGQDTTVTYDADTANRKDIGPGIVSITSYDDRGNEVEDSINTPQGDDETEVTGSSVAGDHFRPSEEWLLELKATLPLETVTRLLQHLVPVVDEICNRKSGVVDEGEILKVLKDVTMVGLLPVPHAIVIRKYQPNQYTALWFTAFMWGVIFLRNQNLPIFDGQAIQLFQVSVAEQD